MRIAVIYNPASGRYSVQDVTAITAALGAAGHDVTAVASRHAGDIEAQVRAICTKTDLVAAVGGDGTFNEVINGLTGCNTPFLPIPMGTANVLSFERGYRAQPSDVVAAVKALKVAPFYPGIANGRRFVLMASAGVDAWAVHLVNAKLKARIGALAYVYAGMRALWGYGTMRYRVTIDGRRLDVDGVIVTRARHYGGPFVIAPEAALESDRLYAVLFESLSLLRMPRLLWAAWRGRLERCPGVRVVRCTQITVTTPAPKTPFQADGDDKGQLPLQVSVDDVAIRLVQPAR